MKKRIPLALLLLFLAGFWCTGCGSLHKPDIEEVITDELDLLKNLDSKAIQKYISYEELFPDANKDSSLPQEVEEVFSLFFQNFDYKILTLDVTEDTAAASLRLQTIDAHALAKDFASERLRQYIVLATDPESTEESADNSLEAHYLLLHDILKKHTYETVETNCTMNLVKENDFWKIRRDRTLENELVGGFISYISDSCLLSAKDAVAIYFDQMKAMDTGELAEYLGLTETLQMDNASRKALANELMKQIYTYFDYEILSVDSNDYTASAVVRLTTMDTQAILKAYETKLAEYLDTAEAVIAGSSGRTRKSQELLLAQITQNTATTTADTTVELTNDGVLWKMELSQDLGQTLLGHLADTSLPEESQDTKEQEEEE